MREIKRKKLNDGADLEAILIEDDSDLETNMMTVNETPQRKENGSVGNDEAQLARQKENKMQNGKMWNENLTEASNDVASENELCVSFTTLNADCLGEILNFLSLIDIKSVGGTCKKLHEITAKHFQLKYPAKKLKIRMPLSYFKPDTTNGFGPYYRNVFVEDADMQIFDFLTNNCKHPLNKIQFGQKTSRKNISTGFGVRIKDHLRTVTSLEFLGCKIHGDLYPLILKYCANLKRLSIRNYAYEGLHIGINDDWLLKRYRTLEHLALIKSASNIEQLKQFFEKNQTIQSFTTTVSIVWLNREVFECNAVNLHQLNIDMKLSEKLELKDFIGLLNKLHKMGRFNQLKLRLPDASILTENLTEIITLNGLNGIYFDCDVTLNDVFTNALGALNKLTTVYIRQPIEVEKNVGKGNLLHGLNNIKEIYIQTIKADLFVDQIVPIIQQSPKIHKIVVRKVIGHLNLKLLKINADRLKLVNATKVKISIDEDTFLKFQWKYLSLEFQTIELKRVESDLANHPFCLHDE